MKRYSESQDDWGMVEDEDGLYVQYSDVKNLERQLAEANARAEEYRTLIASTPNGARVVDAMVARMQVLREVNDTVSLRAYSAVREWGFRMEKRAEQAESERDQLRHSLEQAEQRILESQRQEALLPDGKGYGVAGMNVFRSYDEKLYRSPIIPPTVEEAVKAETERCMRIILNTGLHPGFKANLIAAIRERGEK